MRQQYSKSEKLKISIMNTINNSNTKRFCKDCDNTSLSACKNGNGDNILPCHILRKLAIKCTSVYNLCYKNEDNLINDFYDKINNWCGYSFGIKYLDHLSISKELIMLSMSNVVNGHTGEDLDFINEFSGNIELNSFERLRVIRLSDQIVNMQTKINDEWFAVPGNKEYYIASLTLSESKPWKALI